MFNAVDCICTKCSNGCLTAHVMQVMFWNDTVPEVVKIVKDLCVDEGRMVMCFRHLAVRNVDAEKQG